MKSGTFQFLVTTLILVALSGCGGGGSSGPVTSTQSFPLQSANKSTEANGWSKSFTVSGSCSGTGNYAKAPANTPATFEGVAGFSAAVTITMSFTNCTPASLAQSETDYVDSNYVPLGYNTGASSADANYGVFLTPPSIPVSVTVGGTGIIGTETLYTDSTKATTYGTSNISYIVEADTSTTAIVNLINNTYDTSNTLLYTEQDRYRIASTGALIPVSMDVQYANGSTTHLILTFN